LLNMCLQALLALLYALVPKHGVEALDVLLGHKHVAAHLHIGTSLLPC
jgi:hypothetical protein